VGFRCRGLLQREGNLLGIGSITRRCGGLVEIGMRVADVGVPGWLELLFSRLRLFGALDPNGHEDAGDIIAGVLPIPRGMVEQYELHSASDFFTAEEIELERTEADLLGRERQGPDMLKPNRAGKRYHRGLHVDDTSYVNHQRFIPKPSTRTTKKPPP
jgi:hypothetical protein